MKKINAVLVFLVCLCSSYAYAGIAEDIAKLGYLDQAISTFIEIVNQEKNSEPTIPVANGTRVSAAVRDGELCTDGCKFSWPENANYAPKAKKYVVGEYILFHMKNKEKDVFFRNELPTVKKLASEPSSKPKKEKTATVKEKDLIPLGEWRIIPQEETSPTPVQKKGNHEVEEVYEAVALPLDLKTLENQPLTAIMVPIFKSPWIGDGLGTYTIAEKDGKDVQEFLVRKVWRAYIGSEIFPAVITKFGTYIFVIVPGKNKADLIGEEMVIVSGSGKYALTLSGNMTEFKLKDFEEGKEYRNSFFERNPSKVEGRMLVDISPNTENGKAFMKDLKKLFPNEYYVKGKKISVRTDVETLKSLAGESNNSSYMRRVIQKGGLPNISLASVAFPPFELARMLLVWTIAAFDDTLTGNFLEAKVSGLQAAIALSPYLAECQEEINYMQKIILSAR